LGVDFRKLAAIDVAFLGPKIILAEFAAGALFSIALGIFALFRSHSGSGIAIGIYLLCLGINYVPMFGYALGIGSRDNAKYTLGDELQQSRTEMSKYRRQSLLLLIPLSVPLFALFSARPLRLGNAR
jgi:hypothetical protein